MSSPYDDGRELARVFGRFEYALKRSGFLAKKQAAEADWLLYAKALGVEFFSEVAGSGIANTLINDPPRKLLTDGEKLAWQHPQPLPLSSVEELLVHGVCRVRNSFLHGEKFTGDPNGGNWARDGILVAEALAVLTFAKPRVGRVAAILAE